MSQTTTNQTNAQELEGQTISTQAPKAVAAGKKPEGWVITLPDPFIEKDYEELCKAYGEEYVLECAKAQLRVKFQSTIRSMAQAGRSDEEITSFMQTWKPGDKLNLGGDPQAAILRNFGNLTAEQRAVLMSQLSNMLGQ